MKFQKIEKYVTWITVLINLGRIVSLLEKIGDRVSIEEVGISPKRSGVECQLFLSILLNV